MPDPSVDRYHCYECGGDEIRYVSKFPLKPHEGYGTGRDMSASGLKFNWDYNVCAPCYIEQHKKAHPDEPVPKKVFLRMEIEAIEAKYKEAD